MTKFIFITGNLSQVDIYSSRRLLKMCDIVLFLPVFKIFLLMTLKKISVSMKQSRKLQSLCYCDENDS